ncbi:MAG TPA: hypothetical protein P5102_13095 [Candidatus Competibacteraceae bacterium]|nr:hypothetical protein [Candidatus Competibacteraceae bacterium]HRZ07059.1 hypothetical protein [Candidatus Competibacteraceae bacterium]HSA44996.1 hypothetical protein [Candidatus Competibacteraceae bacterium]
MKNSNRFMIALAIACTSPVVNAEDLVFSPRLTTGYMNYQLKQPAFDIFPAASFEANAPVIGVGTTLYWNRLYLDVYGQISAEASDTSSIPILGYEEEFTGDRRDFSLALGYSITDNLSFYAGYKYGKTDTSGSIGGQAKFKEDGYFLGASYGWVIQDKGVISLNIAVANLDGDLGYLTPAIGFASNQTSETQGLSYGISWKSTFDKNWGYTIALDGYQYKFKDLVDERLGAVPGEISEDMLTARVSISYLFD